MIEIKDLTFSYPGSVKDVFNILNLSIGEGGVYGLLGKNGSGKSTLLYIISGLLRPNYGEVRVDGIESARRSPTMLRNLFLVPEEFDLPQIALDTYVDINKDFYPDFSREVLERCLQDFELSSSLHLGELSMGQKKKVFISFAIATGTRLLLMDEPTNGLDIPSKSQFRKVIAENADEGRTIIISTHQVHDVESLISHVMILNESYLLLNTTIKALSEQYTFCFRQPNEMTPDIIYAEPSLQGNVCLAPRKPGEKETSVNLELLFNAVVQGLIK